MFLSNLSIKQPVFTTMVMLGLVVLGAFGYRRLNVDQFPDVDLPIVTVTTTWKGAGAESVESEVTKRIEEAVHTVAGVKEVRSTSSEGLSSVVIQFNLERNGRDATNDVRDKVAALATVLPTEADAPLIQRLDPASMPIAALGLSSRTLSPRELTDLADRVVKRQLVNVQGVGAVKIVGGARREIHVSLRPDDLRARGVTAATIVQRLGQENADVPAGHVESGRKETTVRLSAKVHSAADFRNLVIGGAPGNAIYLRDVADVEDAQEELRSLALVGDERTVTLDVQKQSGANTVAVVHEIERRLPDIQRDLGGDATLAIVQSNAKMIEESISDVMLTLILGALLTVMVVFAFLNSWRSTVITGLTLPVSVIGAFLMVWIMGFTLNMLTLMALSLAIGLLIDDAIVVRENIVRHSAMGKSHAAAARDGTAEIGMAVLATTLAIVAVFVPVAFMKGIIGRFFFQFGITVAFAVLISLFVSFTLDPMLSSVWPDPHGRKLGPLGRLLDRFSRWFDRLSTRYHRVIMWALTHRKSTMGIAFATFVVTIGLAGKVSAGFMPDWDKGEFQIDLKTPVGSSLAYTETKAREVLKRVAADPDVAFTFTRIGTGPTAAVNEASIYVRDRKEGRKRTTAQIRADLRATLAEVTDVRVAMNDVGGPGGGGQAPIQISVRGPDLAVLDRRAHALLDRIHDVRGLADAQISQERTKPELRAVIDRVKAADRGVSAIAVGQTIQTLVGGQVATQIEDARGERYDVRVQLGKAHRSGKEDLESLEVPSSTMGPDGRPQLVPLDQVARVDDALGPSQIERLELERQVSIAAGVEGRALGDVMKEVNKGVAEMPPLDGYSVSMGGQTRDMVESAGYALESLTLAIIFIYLVLASQFASFLQPLAIMLSLPLALIGVILSLMATGDTLNIMTIIGFIMLMGLVTKNGILLIDNANQRRREGLPRAEAIARAGEIRLRPIIMTTAAMIFGMLPLALNIGEGGGFRAPMARAVIGGLISSTFLTLIVVPVVYSYFDDFGAWFKRKIVRTPATPPVAAPAAAAREVSP